ncbi:MAG: hypothetical protein KGQ36_00050 [Rickettsiales bacterium]|nr:hypothetical protein [Rickettsiales bacterium]
MDWSLDPGNIIIGLLTIGVSYHIAKSAAKGAKEDVKKFVDVAQKAANEAEKNRQITQRSYIISHIVIVKKTLKDFDDKTQVRVGKLREMHDSLLYLFQASDKFNFLKPVEPLVERLTSFVRLSTENDIADHWCADTKISKDFEKVGLKNLMNELENLKKDFDLGL